MDNIIDYLMDMIGLNKADFFERDIVKVMIISLFIGSILEFTMKIVE